MSRHPDDAVTPFPPSDAPPTAAVQGHRKTSSADASAVVEQLNAEANQILEDMTLRKRRPWNPDGSLVSGDIDLDDGLDDEEEEDGVGCPLPSTPEDNLLLEAEVSVWMVLCIFRISYTV